MAAHAGPDKLQHLAGLIRLHRIRARVAESPHEKEKFVRAQADRPAGLKRRD